MQNSRAKGSVPDAGGQGQRRPGTGVDGRDRTGPGDPKPDPTVDGGLATEHGKERTENELAACKETRAEGARGLRRSRGGRRRKREGSAKQLGVRAPSGLLGERGSSLLREASEQREAGRYLARRLQHGSLPGLAARTSRPSRRSCSSRSRRRQAGVRARMGRLAHAPCPELSGKGTEMAGGALLCR